jgi:dienelactone hydrolase
MMHGCSGLIARSGHFFSMYRAWAREFLKAGYVVLVIDSAKSRGFGETCSAGEPRKTMWRDRPKDAYAALGWLQAQPFVKPDRIAIVGWSQGGGIVLLTLSDKSIGRPAGLANDFVAAVAFYPGACAEKWQTKPFTDVPRNGWTTHVPLLVLLGEADVWTDLKSCQDFLSAAKARGNAVDLISYPHALHGFDAPNTARTELPQYREPDGRIPVIGTDKEARADAFARVPAWLAERLGK